MASQPTDILDLPGLHSGEQVDQLADAGPISPGQETEEGQDDPNLYWSDLVGENHIVPAVMRAASKNREYDPEFATRPKDSGEIIQDLEVRGVDVETVPHHWLEGLLESGNPEEYQRQLGRVSERYHLEQELEKLGGLKRFGMELASYASDPVAFAVDYLSGASAKGRFLRRFLSGGLRATAAFGAIEAGLSADGETVRPGEIAAGFAASFVLGGAVGGIAGRRPDSPVSTGRSTPPAARSVRMDESAPQFPIQAKTLDDQPVARSLDVGTVLETTGPVDVAHHVQRMLPEGAPGRAGGDSVGAAKHSGLFPDDSDTATPELDRLRVDIDEPYWGRIDRARFGTAAMMQRSNSAVVRRLAPMLLHTPTKPGETRRISASEIAESVWGRHDGVRARTHNKAYKQWLKRNTGKGFWRRPFAHSEREEFNDMVGKYIQSRGRMDVPEEVVEAANAFRQYQKNLLRDMKRHGVQGADGIPEDDWYIPQLLSKAKMNRARQRLSGHRTKGKTSRDILTDLFATAIKRSRAAQYLEIDDDLTETVARAYVNRGMDANTYSRHQMMDFKGLDLDDLDELSDYLSVHAREEGENLDATLQAVNNLRDKLRALKKRAEDEGLPDRLKHRRVELDMDTTISFRNANDELEELRLGDLFETDVENLSFDYGRFAGAESGLARWGSSTRQMRRAIEELKAEAKQGQGLDPAETGLPTQTDVDRVEAALDATMQRRVQDGNSDRMRRNLAMASAVGFIQKMGSAFWNNSIETTALLAAAGPGRVFRNLPRTKEIIDNLRGKDPEDGFVRQVMMFAGGMGDTLSRNLHGLRHELMETNRASGSLQRSTEGTIFGAKQIATQVNLLGAVNDFSRKLTAVTAVDHLDSILVRGKKPESWWAKRSKKWGLDDRNAELIRNHLKNKVTRGPGDTITDLNLREMDVDTQFALEEFVWNYTAETIQNINSGNLPLWIQKPMGGVLAQFRSFETAGWERHTLADLSYHDSLSAKKFLYTATAAALGYSGRVYMTYPFQEDKREEMLTPRKIASNAVKYTVNVGIMPTALDSIGHLTMDQPILDVHRSSGLSNELSLGSIPGFSFVGDGSTLVRGASGQVRSLMQGRGPEELTREQAQALWAMAGLETMWFTRGLQNYSVRNLPSERELDDTSIDLLEEAGIRDE